MGKRKAILTSNASEVLENRYLKKENGVVVEHPEDMFARVAYEIAKVEENYGWNWKRINKLAQAFYDIIAKGLFLPNSPTLMNAGREIGMLSACFVFPVEDSIEGIFTSIRNTALIQKAGGGTGFDFSKLWPAGDFVASSGGTTSGPISFMKVFSETTQAIQLSAEAQKY